MTADWGTLALLLTSYLIGSVPFGLLVSKLGNYSDPRLVGSGNIGFTNVLRISGKKAGVCTLLGDFGKGFLVAYLARYFVTSEIVILSITFTVIAGHIFSIFLGFKGGKGVATALGAILGLDVVLGSILILIWCVMVLLLKYSSGGALVTFGLFPILTFLLSYSQNFLIFSLLVSFFIILRHKKNIHQLLEGTESKIGHQSS